MYLLPPILRCQPYAQESVVRLSRVRAKTLKVAIQRSGACKGNCTTIQANFWVTPDVLARKLIFCISRVTRVQNTEILLQLVDQ